MPLSCMYDDDFDYFVSHDDDFSQMHLRSVCQSCGKEIMPGDCALKFECYRPADPESDNPDDIKACKEGFKVYLPDEYLCERCGEIYLTLHELGYCLCLGENMEGLLEEYQKMTEFDPAKYQGHTVKYAVEE